MKTIQNRIAGFSLRHIDSITKFTVESGNGANITIDFAYKDFSRNIAVTLTCVFTEYVLPGDYGLYVPDLFALETLTITNIADWGWETARWRVANIDDDGGVLFEFYCRDIAVVNIADANFPPHSAAFSNGDQTSL